MLEEAREIAAVAADKARHYFRKPVRIEVKSDLSPVTEADRSIEDEVRALLASKFPEHGIFGEEQGIEGGDRDEMWIVDPIDGTRSFMTGHPLFGFLLGHLHKGQPDVGVICMPALGEVFSAKKGGPAELNGGEISCSGQTDLSEANIYINEGERLYRDRPEVFERLLCVGKNRRLAFDCYPHALVAAGYVDAVIDYGLEPYDILPVCVVVEAAGGVMTDWSGNALDVKSRGAVVSAATPELHAALLKVLNETS
ncbi:histidinol phosphate phosphatase [Pseudovibrio exalbescens]|uniref:inositol monophosphatase family protein n=1 Tax=Pseudovibrio exalbescens TaxID=197461 RepID=UPI0023673E23|nr:inositol monophosphatase family protein [Pseudovibrio exalbescens]MDD7911450.1 histidinol phosphate phosphatase [Pseudovibrio exalbescens]